MFSTYNIYKKTARRIFLPMQILSSNRKKTWTLSQIDSQSFVKWTLVNARVVLALSKITIRQKGFNTGYNSSSAEQMQWGDGGGRFLCLT